jgi:2-succinyl-5-enolpyruvyl-6-hydroxy-3-cyclohexene-1-carboxylate synthase
MISERFVAEHISQTNWQNRVLFLGTSLPIRNMDRYAKAGEHMPLVVANRGASGIDGIISTAAGFAMGIGEPLILVVGDMTFLHDINGLSFLKDIPTPVMIVVVNNQGNGIFSMLPIAQSADIFERYFKVPHQYNLRGASQIFGLEHQVAQTELEFEEFYKNALASRLSIIIEVRC